MSIMHSSRPAPANSPWRDANADSAIHDEIRLSNLASPDARSQANKVFLRINANGGVGILLDALEHFVPLTRLGSAAGEPAGWFGLPLSGSGNAVAIVIGRDSKNKLRVVGSNMLAEPCASKLRVTRDELFSTPPLGSASQHEEVLTEKLAALIGRLVPKEKIETVFASAQIFMAVPIFIVAWTDNDPIVTWTNAVVRGRAPTAFDAEFAGEFLP